MASLQPSDVKATESYI